MLGWSAPLALLSLLALVPWLRWLHRQRESESELRVPAVFLWRSIEADAGERRARGDPNPRWRLRALVAALFAIAIAGPTLERDASPVIDVYLDDGPTLGVRESDGQTRLSTALDLLAAEIAASSAAEVRLISLTRPGRVLTLPGSARGDEDAVRRELGGWATLSNQRAPLPAAAQLRRDAEHWLVTDGVRPTVVAWATAVPLHRTIQIGRASENAAIVHLSVRRSALSQNSLRGIVRIANGGTQATRRQLEVRSGDTTLLTEEIEFAASAVAESSFSVPLAGPSPLIASIRPGDALADDDALELDMQVASPVPVDFDPACGAFLRAALEAHPGLEVTRAGAHHPRSAKATSAFQVSCATTRPDSGLRTIWLPPRDRGAARATGERFPGAEEALESSFVEETAPDFWLVKVDMTSPEWARQLEYPKFVAALVNRALGRDLLGWSAVTGDAGSVDVRPTPLASHDTSERGVTPAREDLSGFALTLALLFLLVDGGLVWSRS